MDIKCACSPGNMAWGAGANNPGVLKSRGESSIKV